MASKIEVTKVVREGAITVVPALEIRKRRLEAVSGEKPCVPPFGRNPD